MCAISSWEIFLKKVFCGGHLLRFLQKFSGLSILVGLWIGIGLWIGTRQADAEVVVLNNTTERVISFVTSEETPPNRKRMDRLAPSAVMRLSVTGPIRMTYTTNEGDRQFVLSPNEIYFFVRVEKRTVLSHLKIPELPATESSKTEPPEQANTPDAIVKPSGRVTVRILVDEEESSPQPIWQARLRRRLLQASNAIYRTSRIQFEVVSVGMWKSDNTLTDIDQSLKEFERKASSAPAQSARLILGFTSQYQVNTSTACPDGTRNPLHTHLLIPEAMPKQDSSINASEISPEEMETKRLELLIHRLGHFLGAVHSLDPQSPMHPISLDRPFQSPKRIDPINTLAMSVLGEEIRRQDSIGLQAIRPETKTLLRRIYALMAKAMPNDPAASECLLRLERPQGDKSGPKDVGPLLMATRKVIQAICVAAEENRRLPHRKSRAATGPFRQTGDELFAFYVQRAATAAELLPEDVATEAFLLALGIGLDHTSALVGNPLIGRLLVGVETPDERARRLAVLGAPTIHKRRDLALHFVVSCGLTVVVGSNTASSLGLVKELRDARPGGSGFSFVDLSADMAGVAFALALIRNQISKPEMAESFRVDDFMPSPIGLQEGIFHEAFQVAYGSVDDERFKAERAKILQRIIELPGYQAPKE